MAQRELFGRSCSLLLDVIMKQDIISRDEAEEESSIRLWLVLAQHPLWTENLNEFIALWIVENLNFFNTLRQGNFKENWEEFEEIIETYWFSYQLKNIKKDLLDLKKNVLSLQDAALDNLLDISADSRSILFKAWYENIFGIVSDSAVEVFYKIKRKKCAPSFSDAIDVMKELEKYMKDKSLFWKMTTKEIDERQGYDF